MPEISVVIPNWDGEKLLRSCLPALAAQTCRDFETIVVDNGSTDGSLAYLKASQPQAQVICNQENRGFAAAANQGLHAARGRFVAFLNNDAMPDADWLEKLAASLSQDNRLFAVGAALVEAARPEVLEDAGDGYTVFGFAFRRGQGRPAARYRSDAEVFSVCAGAALYRKDLLLEMGGFADTFFAYLEDVDAGWRARRTGYRSRFCAAARVRHLGSASSGSKYNRFKVFLTSRNNVWLLRRNLPAWLLLPTLPLLGAGFLAKSLFYARLGLRLVGAQWRGAWEGLLTAPQTALLPGDCSMRRDAAIWLDLARMTGGWALGGWPGRFRRG